MYGLGDDEFAGIREVQLEAVRRSLYCAWPTQWLIRHRTSVTSSIESCDNSFRKNNLLSWRRLFARMEVLHG